MEERLRVIEEAMHRENAEVRELEVETGDG